MSQQQPVNKSKIKNSLIGLGLSAVIATAGGFLIAPQEGLVLGTYLDPVGIVTSCFGHTGSDLKLGEQLTEQQCLEQFAKDLDKHDKEVMSLVKVPMNNYQHAAILSFEYNAGKENLKNSTMLKYLNNEEYDKACEELIKWVYSKKKKLPGLVARRQKEMNVCLGRNDEITSELEKDS